MNILLISSYIFGYMDFAVEEMRRQGHRVTVFYYDKPPFAFEYKNPVHRTISGIKKIFGVNEKKRFRHNFLKKQLKGKMFDKSIIIHGQYMEESTLLFLKSVSKENIAFFFDSLEKMPRQRNIVHYFDKVYSYEPVDCENENFLFLSNFIPTENYRSTNYKYTVFNISSLDHRLEILKKIAAYLKARNVSFNFQLVNNKLKALENFKINPKRIDVRETLSLVQETKILLDINREDQGGLSFRPFEALGNEKKLITNNPEIQNYEFYNPNNICVIDESDIHIPVEFLESDYEKVPDEIYEKYSIRAWVKNILN